MFIRTKKIKKRGREYSYAYLVENKWRKGKLRGEKGAKQKTAKYLGKVVIKDIIEDCKFGWFLKEENVSGYIKDKGFSELIKDMIRWELFKHDIDEKEFFDEGKIKDKVVFKINDGYLCRHTIDKVNRLKFEDGGDEHEFGIKMIKHLVDAGLKVPEEVFMGLFEKKAGEK